MSDKNKIKQDKPKKEDPEIDASAAPGTAKGKGKSSKGQGSGSAKGTKSDDKPDRTKKPCMYFAYNACSKGSNCPYLHDSKNMYQGPKPQALKDKQANAGAAHVNAGAGTVLAGVLSANTISGSKASEVSCDHAPSQGGDAESRIHKAKKFCKSVIKSGSKSCVPRVGMFEKTFKVFAAMLACTNPIEPRFTQDFFLTRERAGT